MEPMKPVKLFFSYSHKDEDLRNELEKQLIILKRLRVIETWHDRNIDAGEEWKTSIDENLNTANIILLLISSDFLSSDYCYEKEMKRALERYEKEGTEVIPVILRPCHNWQSAPFGKLQALPKDAKPITKWSNIDEAFTNVAAGISRVVTKLNQAGPQSSTGALTAQLRPAPFMAPSLPDDFVNRPDVVEPLIAYLLDKKREGAIAITAALRGAGGYGKTTLAMRICDDPRIWQAFSDGILWVTISENPGDLTNRFVKLVHELSGEHPVFSNVDEAIDRLRELTQGRALLLVIDDVWREEHLRPFLQGTPHCAHLITSRIHETLPLKAKKFDVEAMPPNEAVNLLRTELETTDELDEELRALADRLWRWPFLLKLVNAKLRDRVQDEKLQQPLIEALRYVNQALDKHGPIAFDAKDSNARHKAVAKTLTLSFEGLGDARSRYDALVIFPENLNIPLATLAIYWGLDDFETETLCERFYKLSLLEGFDIHSSNPKMCTIRLHSVISHYQLQEQRSHLPALHNQLLDAYCQSLALPLSQSHLPKWSVLSDDEPYLWNYLAFHLDKAGRGKELAETVKDWRYLAKKTRLYKSLSVESDLLKAEEIDPTDDTLRTLRRSFANSGHLFNRCDRHNESEIIATLFVRLKHLSDLKPALRDLGLIVQGLKQGLKSPCITLKFALPDLPHPALIRTLAGYSSNVKSCTFSPDGKLIISSSVDDKVNVWDAKFGELIRSFEGHLTLASGRTFSPSGRLIVSTLDKAEIPWDRNRGTVKIEYKGTVKIIDAKSGEIVRTLEGHQNLVNSCVFSPDGKYIVTASDDGTLRVWDAHLGTMLRALEGHLFGVKNCAFSPDGKQIVSASDDGTLKVWDAELEETLPRLEGHSDAVWSCDFSLDGKQIISASSDHKLKIWDAESGKVKKTLEGHSAPVRGCRFSPDSKLIVSASDDGTLIIWNAESGDIIRKLEKFEVRDDDLGKKRLLIDGHSDAVMDCSFSPDGKQIVSVSVDGTLKIWDAESWEVISTLEGHQASIKGCAFNPDGSLIVFASSDGTSKFPKGVVKVWKIQTGEMLDLLEDNLGPVNGCDFSPEGSRILSASDDGTLRIWDAESGQMLHEFKGHSKAVRGCRFSPNGELLVSASEDCTLKIWNVASRRCLTTFYADGPMYSCAIYGEMIVGGGARGVYFLKLVR
jgi:WD40 repeat protein